MRIIRTDIKEKLEYLSKLPETEYPFISLYINVNAHELFKQAQKNKIFLKNSFQNALNQLKKEENRNKWVSFMNDQEKIMDYINNNLDSRAHGVAIFACEKLGVFESFQSLMPFDNNFVINTFAHLKQLAYHASEYENVLVTILDSKYARIFNIKLGDFIVNEITTENLLHRFHKQGGWSQLRYQRHIDKQVEEHYKELSDLITEFIDKENYKNIILIGQEHEIKNFQLNLPKRINKKVINIDNLQMRENINNILETIIKDLYKNKKEKELKNVMDIINKTLTGEETLGMQDTIELAKQGRVNILTVAKDLTYNGWKCDSCFYTEKNQYHAGCPKCNGNLKQTDLVEEAVNLTFKNNGKVEIVEEEAAIELAKHEGIGAYLRY